MELANLEFAKYFHQYCEQELDEDPDFDGFEEAVVVDAGG